MAKYDAEERRARGETVPPDVELYLKSLAAGAVEAGGVTDIYEAAGIGRPDLSHLDEAFIARMREQRNPHLAIEALRRLVEQEMRRVTKHNVVAQQSFSERLSELMRKYTNQNLTAAQISPSWWHWPRRCLGTRGAESGSRRRSTTTSSRSTTLWRRTNLRCLRWGPTFWQTSRAIWWRRCGGM
jgi:hypothetical protein